MIEKNTPSRLSNLKELIRILDISVQIQAEVSAILSDYEVRVYSLEEDRRRLIADYRSIEQRCQSLEKRYSEVLYRLSERDRLEDK